MQEWSTLKKLIWLFAAVIKGGASWAWSVVTGNAPLTLSEAVAHEISRITQYGLCTQSATPTPSAPVDIMCNNGVLRFGALGQNLLDPSAASTVLGYYINKADGAIKDSPYNFMFAGYMPVEAGKTYVAYGRAKSGNDLSDYNRVAWYDSTKTWIAGANYTQNQIAIVTAPENAAYARFSCNPSGGTSVPVTQAIVDSYNWTFCEGNAEVVPFVPFVGGIYADGTPETLSVGGKNLNGGTIEHKGYTSTGGESTSTTFAGTLWKIPCAAGQKFTVSWGGFPDGLNGVFVNTWKTDGTWNLRQAISASTSLTYTIGAGVGEVNFTLYKTGGITIGDDAWIQVEYGETATDYQPYITPQTVTDIPMLLSAGDYADEGEIIGGIKTGKIGVYVIDGTESVSASGAGWAIAIADKIRSKVALLCTHYPYSSATMANAPDKSIIAFSSQNIGIKDTSFNSAADVKAFSASEYAAGHPIIVVYPLAEETTEQTTPHALHTTQGTNVVGVTANVSPVSLEVEYAKTQA